MAAHHLHNFIRLFWASSPLVGNAYYDAPQPLPNPIQRHPKAPKIYSLSIQRYRSPTHRNTMYPDPKTLLDQLPEKPHRSKLGPYAVLIRGLRQKRYTYQEIADVLAAHYNLQVHPSTVFDFFKRHPRQPDHRPSPQNVSQKRFHYDPEEGLTLSDEALNLKLKKD